MALLKTYSISGDITAGVCSAPKMHNDISNSSSVTSFDGVTVEGDILKVYGDSFANETLLDSTVLNHDGIPPIDTKWRPPVLSAADHLSNGVIHYVNTGAGYQISFPEAVISNIYFHVQLNHDGLIYDGSDLALQLESSLYNDNPSGKNVKWQVKYAFVKADGTENWFTKLDATNIDTIDVTGRTPNMTYTDILTTMNGVVGAEQLLISLSRISANPGADTFTQNVDLYKYDIIKV